MLLNLGLSCSDVKLIEKTTTNGYNLLLYIVYFSPKSVTIKQLRDDYSHVNHTKVRWDDKTKIHNKLTQCHNCQLYGHGAKQCEIKTSCAYCVKNHLASECPNKTAVSCANCKGNHPSTDANCPCRLSFQSLLVKRSKHSKINNENRISNFPTPQ